LRSGIRASELCDLRVGEVRLHDPEGARFRIPDAKTEAGVREVQMSPELVEEFVSHFDRLRRAGRRTDPDAYAFPNTRGGRIARQRVARVVGEAAARASERVSQCGLPPLPHTTPHTLRRTYISIALLANRFDVLWVMGQVGHADSKMTLDVYAQLQQRVKREHGRAFDTLVRQAREQLYGTPSGLPEAAPEPNLGHESGHEATLGESDARRAGPTGEQESSDLQADRGMARPGLEPGTPRFSGVRFSLSNRAETPAYKRDRTALQRARHTRKFHAFRGGLGDVRRPIARWCASAACEPRIQRSVAFSSIRPPSPEATRPRQD
jgi:integrase-like protein